jgi:thioredoxin-dependent peroxiredoxin
MGVARSSSMINRVPVVQVGDLVPDFELDDQTGATRKLSDLVADGPIVLFFYPAAMSAGCTVESCHFRDLSAELGEVGAKPVGISGDSVDKQRQFADKHGFGYPLLSDPGRKVAETFGVKRSISLVPIKRKTFVIDSDRRVIGVVSSEVRMGVHADKALDLLRSRASSS